MRELKAVKIAGMECVAAGENEAAQKTPEKVLALTCWCWPVFLQAFEILQHWRETLTAQGLGFFLELALALFRLEWLSPLQSVLVLLSL